MKLLCLLLIVVTLFSSCFQRANRYVYASQAANINYFKQKGDSKITGYYSHDGDKNDDGYNIQGGYALTNHLALMGAYTHKRELSTNGFDSVRYHGTIQSNIFDSSVIHYKRNTFEIGIGYFLSLTPRKTITFNLYSGISLGKYSFTDAGLDSNKNNYNRFYDSRVTKYFVQGSFNFMPINELHLSVGQKISLLNFPSVSTSYTNNELNYFYLDKMRNKNFAIWEEFINLQIAIPQYPWIKVDGQISFSSKLDSAYPRVRSFNGSVGITIELDRLLKKRKN